LAREDLLGRVWRFRRSDGPVFAERVRLISDGAIAGHDGAFEAFWSLDGDTVVFHAANGLPTTRFATVDRRTDGHLTLAGDFLLAPELALRFVLESAPPHAPAPGTQRLAVAMGLAGRLDALLVLFNSIGKPFDGLDTRWEFYDLPRRLGLDHVRLAERIDPAHWYVDQAATICALLEPIIARGYRRIILAGLSSGGYASLLIGSMLGLRHPGIALDSFTINPQTGHAAAHRSFMASLPAAMPPAVMDDATFATIADHPHEIAALLRSAPAGATMRHHLFYDHDNPAERYYVDLVRDCQLVEPIPVHFGVGHMAGCIALMERAVVQDAIADALAADQAAASASRSVLRNR
jgi:hypothetical protein